MSTTIGAAAVQIFQQGRVKVGEIAYRCAVPEDEVFWQSGDASNTATNAQVIRVDRFPQASLPAMWRGYPILSEHDLATGDFPYPPETEWQDT